MKTYVVGGWVRDELLRRRGRRLEHRSDRDWVVVGATPQEMLALGYKAVGRDFPVFLHPQTHEEYALARTERKVGPGYRGFVVHADPGVTLEEDLGRRDLTINAMALDEEGGLVDPYGGQKDLEAGVLRHVGPAFVEDPVRILRLARFAARFGDFTVDLSTRELLQAMVRQGEADALVPERVWQEVSRGLMEARPSRLVEVLDDCGFIARIHPELGRPRVALAALDRAADRGLGLAQRFAIFAALAAASGRVPAWLEKLRADSASAQLALLLAELRYRLDEGSQEDSPADDLAAVLERADAIRRPERFAELLAAWSAIDTRNDPRRWQAALDAARSVDAGEVAASAGQAPAAIAAAIAAARRAAIALALDAGMPG